MGEYIIRYFTNQFFDIKNNFSVKQVLRNYFKEEQTSRLAIELFEHLREGDSDGAKDITAEFYQLYRKQGEISDTEQNNS